VVTPDRGEQTFDILIDARVKRRFRKLSGQNYNRIIDAIEGLKNNPTPHGCIKLKGGLEGFRIRVGNYRVLYKVDWQYRMVEVYYVLDRKEGYPLRM